MCLIQSQVYGVYPNIVSGISLAAKMRRSLELFPCELLFIHRDAENQQPLSRTREIRDAMNEMSGAISPPPYVCIIPVRMMEAWMLIDEMAIRRAAGNSTGRMSLDLPRIASLENIPDPKDTLYNLLRQASGLNARRRKAFPVAHHSARVAEFINDYEPLRQLPAFQTLEADIDTFLLENPRYRS
jgi:hypothetical protein